MKEIQRQGHIKTNKEVQRQRQRNTKTKKYKDRYKTILKPPSQSDPGAFWPLRHLIKMTKKNIFTWIVMLDKYRHRKGSTLQGNWRQLWMKLNNIQKMKKIKNYQYKKYKNENWPIYMKTDQYIKDKKSNKIIEFKKGVQGNWSICKRWKWK